MLQFREEGILLASSERDFESEAVFNPTCLEEGGVIHMLYRATKPGNVSTLGYCQLTDNEVTYRSPDPVLWPEHPYEAHGIEDPRLTKIDGVYHLFYTAYDGTNARIAHATATELPRFTKHGPVSPDLSYAEIGAICRTARSDQPYHYFCRYPHHEMHEHALLWEKDGFLFPEKINGRYALAHRIVPEIQVVYFDDFAQLKDDDFWDHYLAALERYVLLKPKYWFESAYIGGGGPPILTDQGWLMVYHAVTRDAQKQPTYRAGAVLLDRDDPTKTIARLPEPLFSPALRYERYGIVPNVIFPTATLVRDGRLYIYCGAADHCVTAKSVSLDELLAELLTHKEPDHGATELALPGIPRETVGA